MSESASPDEALCLERPCPGIELIIKPKLKDLGGLQVRRLLPYVRRRMVGPWIFFDHMGPASFPPGRGIDVRPHPHINLATVTYLFEGEMLHRDSLGSVQIIQPGAINLMFAGSGIVHSERERQEVRSVAHQLNGLQLWLALPAAVEESPPAFFHYPASAIPEIRVEGVMVRVMMGQAFGVRSPVHTYAETLYLEAAIESGQSLALPESTELAIYVVTGQAILNGISIGENEMAVLENPQALRLQASGDTRLVLIGGESPGRRHIDWNFVSSRPDRIEQAKQQWRAGAFPRIPGDDQEFIPLP